VDHTRFIKITDKEGDRWILNIDHIDLILQYIDDDRSSYYIIRKTDKTIISITKEQFEEFWG
jgi:hypothetical protein